MGRGKGLMMKNTCLEALNSIVRVSGAGPVAQAVYILGAVGRFGVGQDTFALFGRALGNGDVYGAPDLVIGLFGCDAVLEIAVTGGAAGDVGHVYATRGSIAGV
jgi:hypothetical protein